MSALHPTLRQLVADEVRRALAANDNHTAAPPPETMTADEVAAFLGVDRKTVYDYANRGRIPHQRLGKRLLFSRTALVAWLGACRVASTGKGM